MRIQLPSGTPAELVHPAKGPGHRGLVIATDIFGLRPLYDDLCRRLSNENDWSVCAVELWPGNEQLDAEQKWARVSEVDQREVIGDLEAAADALSCARVGLIGFCMGGMYALRASGLSNRFERIVSFYGMIRIPENALSVKQSHPIDALRGDSLTPLLAIMGGKDPWCPLSDQDELESIGNPVQVVRYPHASHAFVHDTARAEHRPDDAKDAWQKAIEFLEEPSNHVKEAGERKPGILGSSPP